MAFDAAWAAKHVQQGEWLVDKRQVYVWKHAHKTLVRYMEDVGLTPDAVKALLEYLTSSACAETLTLMHKPVDGSWKPVRAWYDTNYGQPDANTKLARIRLYHAMIDANEESEDGPYVIDNGCRYKETVEFYWDVASIREVEESTSGVSYRIEGIQIDRETGLYSYEYVKRERQQQDVPKHVVVNPATGEKIWEESHLGVKDTALAAYEALNNTAATDGTLITVRVSKNEDCTFDVQIEYREMIKGTSEETCAKTQFEHEHGTTKTGQGVPAAGGDVDDAKDGVTHTRRVSIEPGGKAEIRETKTTELPVSGAQATTEQDAFSQQDTVTDRNQASADVAAVAAANGVTVLKRVEATAGKLWNNFKQTVKELAVAAARVATQADAFGTRTVTTNRNQAAAAAAPTGVTGGSGGHVLQVTDEITPGKLHNQTIDDAKETNVKTATQTKSEDAFESSEEHLDRSEAAADIEPGYAAGSVAQKSTAATPGGLHNNSVRTVTEKAVADAGLMHEQDLYSKTDETTKRGQAAADEDVTTGGSGGIVITKRNQKSQFGKFAVTTTQKTERAVASARTAATGDLFSASAQVTNANGVAPSDTPGYVSQTSIKTVQTEKTPGGKVTSTVATETPGNPVEFTLTWEDSDYYYSYYRFINRRSLPDTSTLSSDVYRVSVSPNIDVNKFGLYSGSVLRRVEKYDRRTYHYWWWKTTEWYKTGQQSEENQIIQVGDKTYSRKITYTFDEGYCDVEKAHEYVYHATATKPGGTSAGTYSDPAKNGSYVRTYGAGAFWRRVTAISVTDTEQTLPLANVSL